LDEAKILLFDIETAPVITYQWATGLYKANTHPEQLIKDTYLLSFSAKWFNNKKVIYYDQSNIKEKENDYKLCLKLRDLLSEADIVIAHNGRAFDLRFINARFAIWGIDPPSPYQQIDTYEASKKHFGFTYNRLEYLAIALKCKHQKLKHGKYPGLSLWIECLTDNKDAWAEMKRYNINDTLVLEDVYVKLRPYIVGHPNLGIFVDVKNPVCPKCGGDVQRRGEYKNRTNIYNRYRCNKCLGWSRGRKSINPVNHKNKQLVN
jgi:DNA polymerase elongation subunit (family B)